VWNECNSGLFQQKENTTFQLLEKVKSRSLWWLQAKKVCLAFGTHVWWSNPLLCLGIG
jgi:hypothetical protein